jgi:hypothetical protein
MMELPTLGGNAMTRWLLDILGSVGEQIARAGHLFLYLDYGTLATIVDEPDQACSIWGKFAEVGGQKPRILLATSTLFLSVADFRRGENGTRTCSEVRGFARVGHIDEWHEFKRRHELRRCSP